MYIRAYQTIPDLDRDDPRVLIHRDLCQIERSQARGISGSRSLLGTLEALGALSMLGEYVMLWIEIQKGAIGMVVSAEAVGHLEVVDRQVAPRQRLAQVYQRCELPDFT